MIDNPTAALERLQAVSSPFEMGWPILSATGTCLHPVYTRGEAYLAAGRSPAAAREFQKILDHPGLVLNCPTGALAHFGLARAYALQTGLAATSGFGRTPASHQRQSFAGLKPGATNPVASAIAEEFRAKARTAYQDFLALWKRRRPRRCLSPSKPR